MAKKSVFLFGGSRLYKDDNGDLLSAANLHGYRSSDSTFQPLRMDKATGSLQTIDYSHHEVHAGDSYFYTDVLALGNGAAQDYLITTPNTTAWAHLGFEIGLNDGAGTIELYEAADRTGTTAQTLYNANRNSANTPGVTVHKGQSGGTTDGTRIIWSRSGSGKTSGGQSGSGDEIILKQNTKYILRITNATTNTNNVAVKLHWYEHTNIG